MLKADGTFMVWADGGGGQAAELDGRADRHRGGADDDGRLTRLLVRKRSQEELLDIAIAEVLSDVEHELDVLATLEKEGVERELQELLAGAPQWCGEGLRLVRREWPTDIGPVDLMCRDGEDEWIAVEIKRIATIDAVEQLTPLPRAHPPGPRARLLPRRARRADIKPQARVLAGARGIDCVEVDLEVLRGEREPELKLFAA